MWNNTRRMAESIAEGIKEADKEVTIKIFNSAKADKNDILGEVFKSKAILVGSSTINKGILFSTAGLLEMIKGLEFKEKKAVAFGSYGWSGESIKFITKELNSAGLEVINDGIKVLWSPDDTQIERCKEYGKKLVELI
jgi:flavorubredoxin